MERKISKKNIVGIVFGCLSFNLILFIAFIDHLLLRNNISGTSLMVSLFFAVFFAIAIGVPALVFFLVSLKLTSNCNGFKQLPLVIAGVVLTAGVSVSCWFGIHKYNVSYDSIPYAKYEAALDYIQNDGKAYVSVYNNGDYSAGNDEGATLVDTIGKSKPTISNDSPFHFSYSTYVKYESMDGVYTLEMNYSYLRCTYNPKEEDKATRKTWYRIEQAAFNNIYNDALTILSLR